jgi:hypothetical protein
MPASFNHHPSSYRDPSGFIFEENGCLYRQVNQCFQKDFDRLMQSGLYQKLVEKNILVPHQTIHDNLTGSTNWHLTLKPEVIPFVSYPYEWCFNMLKDAALLTLEAAKEAMKFGMMLKDASAYNVQLHKGKTIFIDTLSFEQYDEQKPWIAYRQFCEQFFAPLSLMHYMKEPLQNLLMSYPEGIPLQLSSKMLPFKSKWNLHSYLHLHLQSTLARKNKRTDKDAKPFSKQKLKNLLLSLEAGIQSFSFSQSPTNWSNYYEEAHQRGDYIAAKKQIVSDWIRKLNPKTVFDAGANEGEFSELASASAYVISADADHASINKLYQKVCDKNNSNICPLVVDLANPSPAIGLNNNERSSFLDRIKVDLVLALALIHHLSIGKNIPFGEAAKSFFNMTQYLIIEFVPKDDEKVKLITAHKKELVSNYSEESFETSFLNFFSIDEKKQIASSGRTLYLMQRHNLL